MRNPVNYKITASTTPAEIRRIFVSLRKRARAAYTFKRNGLISKFDIIRWDESAANLENELKGIETYVLAPDSTLTGREAETIQARRLIREYEGDAYHAPRGRKHIASLRKSSGKEPTTTENLQLILRRVRNSFPYAAKEHPQRLGAAISRYVADLRRMKISLNYNEVMHALRDSGFTSGYLALAGVPAASIAGPWVPPGISPKEYIAKLSRSSFGIPMSATVQDWMHAIDLDSGDNELSRRIVNYAIENKRIPSKQTAREINNALEREREEKSIEESVEDVRAWLRCSRGWQRDSEVTIPPLLDQWRVVLPSDAEALCRRAKRDGLCVVDVLVGLYDEEEGEIDVEARETDDPVFARSKKEGVCVLLFSTDPTCRTVVGLNEDGVCTSQHHATGKNNAVDKAAWEQFKA